MTLGQRICQYRKQLNISQEELGDRLGVSRQAVSKWETDLSAPDMNNLLALAREFGISVAELTETPEKTWAASKLMGIAGFWESWTAGIPSLAREHGASTRPRALMTPMRPPRWP